MKLTNDMLLRIGEVFALHLQDPDEVVDLKVSGMKFRIRAWQVQGLGHVSAMTAAGFFGLMKMDTLIITPTEVDMPLYSYDRVHAMGNDTMIFELYDTLLDHADLSMLAGVREAARKLPDHDLGSHWYDPIKLPVSLSKKGRKKDTPAFDETAMDYLNAFLAAARRAPACNAASKREKASVYVEGLLTHGGPSTDVFRKGIGQEKTADLFRRVLFATDP